MLNRRSLRVKVMQTLFAYYQCREANFNLGRAEVEDFFKPNLNSMEPQDKEVLKKKSVQARKLFGSKVYETTTKETIVSDKDVEKAVADAHKLFLDNTAKDFILLKKEMIRDAEALVDYFLWIISLLLGWAELNEKEVKKKQQISPERLLSGDFNLSKNVILKLFKESHSIQTAIAKKDIHWQEEEDTIKNWYKEVLKKDELFNEYRRTANPGFKEDKAIIEHIVKSLIFKTDVINSFFEAKDMHWEENKPIVRSLVTRSIRDIEKNTQSKDISLPDFSNNWEEDREFFEKILEETVQRDKELSDMIAAKTKNWEIDRIAGTDQIILKMALAEMLNFRNIPVKVTINEYIELSKNYSTPKSKQFVNGILDVVSSELKTSGKLKKSGRGLLDNK